ncbi:MAG: hypothetical protein JXA42_01345 [Anaerolineales bacterium]|nr:hypothetical protein [Anaerolineales bacterium]
MLENDIRFQGTVRVYLQGKEALELADSESQSTMSYFVGAAESRILIHDQRSDSTSAAMAALSGGEMSLFSRAFNRPARATVRSTRDLVEVELSDDNRETEEPVLWLGVIDDHMMPAHNTDWEFLRPIGESKVAFLALIR